MDMLEPYVQATLEWLPLGKDKIVFDRIHIIKEDERGGEQGSQKGALGIYGLG